MAATKPAPKDEQPPESPPYEETDKELEPTFYPLGENGCPKAT